jgi:nicotinate dehydrogenase subunit B
MSKDRAATATTARADAALIATMLPIRVVHVERMREQELAWESFSSAMIGTVRALLGADDRIDSWTYDLWSNTHSTRPDPTRRHRRIVGGSA